MASSSSSKTITLKSNDEEEFVVPEAVALQSQAIRNMIEDNCAKKTIPLPNVNARILAKVLRYCEQLLDAAHVKKLEMEQEEWDRDREFFDVDQKTLFDLLLAANYLDISKLFLATCKKVASMMEGKSPEKIRQIFNIKNDYTAEQEEEVRRESQWAFE